MADDAQPMEVDDASLRLQKGKAPAVPGDYRDAATDAAPWVRGALACAPRTHRIARPASRRPRAMAGTSAPVPPSAA
jgi:hypothetical protein